jgi:hypothetical protein
VKRLSAAELVPYYDQEGIDTLGLAVELLKELVTGFGRYSESTIKFKTGARMEEAAMPIKRAPALDRDLT